MWYPRRQKFQANCRRLSRRVKASSAIVCMNFGYKAQTTQTTVDIAERILRQLLSYFDNPELESLYNQRIQKGVRPEIVCSHQLLKSCSLKFSTIYAVFDTFDQCSEAHQDVFLAQLRQLNYWLLISSRLHWRQQLQDRLPVTETLTVKISASPKP